MTPAIDALRRHLNAEFASIPAPFLRPGGWCGQVDPELMVADVKVKLGIDKPVPIQPSRDVIAEAVEAFCRTGEPRSLRQLRHACLGVSMIVTNGRSILADADLLGLLLQSADGCGNAKQQTKCFQALLRSYWSFPLNEPLTKDSARKGWRMLGTWLDRKREILMKFPYQRPVWMDAITRHANLLHDNPCDPYGEELARGIRKRLIDAMDSLIIPSSSWVIEEAMFSQIKASCRAADAPFRAALDTLLPLAAGRMPLREDGSPLPVPTQRRCVSELVKRYAACGDPVEHPGLRDAAVSLIGNPWLDRNNWDVMVVNSTGRPDNAAREMVNGWLKRRLIGDFFALLAHDGAGNTRRYDYWLRFEPFITDMWFVLGKSARKNETESFRDFRDRAKGRLLSLKYTNADNNVFLMRLGEFLGIEYGAHGNAFYLLRWREIPELFREKLLSANVEDILTRQELLDVCQDSTIALKGAETLQMKNRLLHKDGKGISWEEKFDTALKSVLRWQPDHQPLSGRDLMLKDLRDRGLKVADHSPQGGYLRVVASNNDPETNKFLMAYGFQYNKSRGWYLET